jgi:hypothetical protein
MNSLGSGSWTSKKNDLQIEMLRLWRLAVPR